MSSSVSDFFAGQAVLITGGSGFLGKVLVFKLLKSCPNVSEIILLIRSKRGTTPKDRLQKLLQGPMFQEVASEVHKVTAIAGDMASSDLGIQDSDRQRLVATVSVIFHSAATVKFDDIFTKAVLLNVRGTRDLLILAKEMANLKAFVHVSTAYSHCYKAELDESIPVSKPDPEDLIRLCEDGDADELNGKEKTTQLLGKHPNTYTFTKAKAEQLVQEAFSAIPTVIVRPSIVVGSLREPFPGWIDNMNGPTGMVIGAGAGFLRTMLVKRECKADIIPVDLVINLLCVAAQRIGTAKPERIQVFNMCSSSLNPITWGQVEEEAFRFLLQYPPEKMMWYPGGSFKSNASVDIACQILFHYIPAYAIDFFCLTTGRKPYMVNILNRMVKAVSALQTFTNQEWSWSTYNVEELFDNLSSQDRAHFDFDIRAVNWRSFWRDYVKGTREYVLKCSPSTQEESLRKLKKLRYLHNIVELTVILAFLAIFLNFVLDNFSSSKCVDI